MNNPDNSTIEGIETIELKWLEHYNLWSLRLKFFDTDIPVTIEFLTLDEIQQVCTSTLAMIEDIKDGLKGTRN